MANTQTGSNFKKETDYKPKEPSMYNVIMHNDDVTTMEFVVEILVSLFRKTPQDAERIMLRIHHEGRAIVGTYHKDIAESKAAKAMRIARSKGFPLTLTTEEEQ